MRRTFLNVLAKLGLLLIVLTAMAGCISQTVGAATDRAYCAAFRPKLWSVLDTPESIKQDKAHNAVGKKLCGWKPDDA